ncbi:YcjX family protein [Humitalea sp. 24SJ18S-53]|uniref:YcjX family protein n=1 Tax=Humitalea sp. 24SJ18S-53 TaxID=3422307 RepID=UPI003D6705D0
MLDRLGGGIRAWRGTRTVTIAVAGLARSGKTALITSVIANLQATGQSATAAKWLRGLDVVDGGRLRSAEIPATFRPSHGRMFPFHDMLAALTANMPHWPSRTANVYEAAVDLHFWPGRAPPRGDARTARLRLVFMDYPGEWLVDVPLLDQGFAEWSTAALRRLERGPWAGISAPFRALLAGTDWTGPDNDEVARKAARAWQAVLLAARDDGLKWLQPGQFVRKRDQAEETAAPALDETALWFCPLPAAAIEAAKKGSLAAGMAGRYAAYQRNVAVFFKDTLGDASRHVLLVDVLEALAEGEAPFYETAEILSAVYRTFTGRRSVFQRWFGRAGFDKVLLLATKADTVPPNQRAALKSLLAEMCARRVAGAASIGPPATGYVAAIRATEEVEVVTDTGDRVLAVQGFCGDAGRQRRVSLFDIPESMPTSADFARRTGLRPPSFVPPRIESEGRHGIPNTRLGQVLDDLVGDLLA